MIIVLIISITSSTREVTAAVRDREETQASEMAMSFDQLYYTYHFNNQNDIDGIKYLPLQYKVEV